MEQLHHDAIKKIVQYTKQNEDFGKALRKELEIAPSAISVLSNNKDLEEIYEYCIKQVIETQAKNFYSKFPINEIVPQLEKDFVRMEDFKRHNEFGDYALAVYQQIENICNYIFQLPLFYAYLYYKLDSEKFSGPISKAIFGTDSDKGNFLTMGIERLNEKKLGARDKYKSIMYLIGTSIKDNFYYVDLFGIIDSIYLCRNTSHRGDSSQSNDEKIKTAYNEYSMNFMKFNGGFVNFITLIQDGYQSFQDKLNQCIVTVTKTMNGTLFYEGEGNRIDSAEYTDNTISVGDRIIIIPKNKHKKFAIKV